MPERRQSALSIAQFGQIGPSFGDQMAKNRPIWPNDTHLALSMTHEEVREHVRALVQDLMMQLGRDPRDWRHYRICDCGQLRARQAQWCRDCFDDECLRDTDRRWPPLLDILVGVRLYGIAAYAASIGFSDNGVRKHLRARGIEPPSRANGQLVYPTKRQVAA
ncbi:MAG: hypothetical protein ABIQ01_05775 [Pseudolysinimonas sp.]